MKKARIFLAAITVLALVGGALAFKPTKFQNRNVYCNIANQTGVTNLCPLQNLTRTNNGEDPITSFQCPLTTGYYTSTATSLIDGVEKTICTSFTTGTVYPAINE